MISAHPSSHFSTRLRATAEGLTLTPAHRSPNGKPLLIVGHEVSGTTTVLQINLAL